MDRYTVGSLIGEGSFGRVYKAMRTDEKQIVAIKIISKRGRTDNELKNFRRECEIQTKLKHPNVIEMLESFETKNDLVVVTEFALYDLHRFLLEKGPLKEEPARRMICHLVSALYYLHSHRILHRDLKPQNVLLNETLHAKLCDFGLARNMTTSTYVLTSIKGTPLYMAPELLAAEPYDHQADLWSLGCISYESMAGQPPFCTTSILHLAKLIKHEEVKMPSFLSSDCCSFLQGLLEKDPSMRITWTQILCHPFVEGKLFIANVKADEANDDMDDMRQKQKCGTNERKQSYQQKASAITESMDNLASSSDSINAIPPSDYENLETDVEDKITSRIAIPFVECSFKALAMQRVGGGLKPAMLPYAAATELAAAPVVNSQTQYVSGNANMILNHLNDNFAPEAQANAESINAKSGATNVVCLKQTRNKDLEKRKLSQNLDNFTLRLVQSKSSDSAALQQRKQKEKSWDCDTKSLTRIADEKRSEGNSPPFLMPGWDSCDESQSPPIENEEWLAFLNRTMQEVLDGELDALRQQNLVSIIVAPLRNSKALPKVVSSVAQLLSLPFVLCKNENILENIKNVYIDVKLVPNLMYASKLLVCQKSTTDSAASLQNTLTNRAVRALPELSLDELGTASRLYELICHLVHLKQQCLSQFCDAVAILSADELLINFLKYDLQNAHALRIANCVLALFCCVLRELPENAELVEKIIFSSNLSFVKLLANKNDLLRIRLCMLLRLLARFSLRGLQSVWCTEIKLAMENLLEDDNAAVRMECENTLSELSQFTFYA